MRAFPVLVLAVAAAFAFRSPEARIAPLIDEFDAFVQQRLADPLPKDLGMSRIVRPSSFGRHFEPTKFAARDFEPRNDAERVLIADLEARKVQLGVYLFGESVSRADVGVHSYRAMKGPGIVTSGTPRSLFFPAKVVRTGDPAPAPTGDLIPNWRAVYPIAQQAMEAFAKGATQHDAQIGSWTLTARPAVASSGRCIGCHNNDPAFKGARKFAEGDVLGGAIYVYRAAP